MGFDENKEKREACQHILGYLLDNPDASDTLDGIMEWWLLNQKIRYETRIVLQAVNKLIADGLIVEQEGLDSRTSYRINRSEDIKGILRETRNLSDD
jgi:hypothetical protein